ncbi:hypothetical protein DWZ57_22020, partial [Bacteroides fragilis]
MNKTIVYIGGFELPDKNAAAQRVISNAKIFRKLGYHVIFVGIDKYMADDVEFEDTKLEFEGFIYYRVKYPCSIFQWVKYLSDVSFLYSLKQFSPLQNWNFEGFIYYRVKYPCSIFQWVKYLSDVSFLYSLKQFSP